MLNSFLESLFPGSRSRSRVRIGPDVLTPRVPPERVPSLSNCFLRGVLCGPSILCCLTPLSSAAGLLSQISSLPGDFDCRFRVARDGRRLTIPVTFVSCSPRLRVATAVLPVRLIGPFHRSSQKDERRLRRFSRVPPHSLNLTFQIGGAGSVTSRSFSKARLLSLRSNYLFSRSHDREGVPFIPSPAVTAENL